LICRECGSSDIQVTSDKGPNEEPIDLFVECRKCGAKYTEKFGWKPGEFHGILGQLRSFDAKKDEWRIFKGFVNLLMMIAGGLLALSVYQWDLILFAISLVLAVGVIQLSVLIGFIDDVLEGAS